MINLPNVKAWSSKNILQLVLEKKTADSRQVESLDGLRGIAALFVFLDHVSGQGVSLAPFLDFTKTGMGLSGVYLFFVLSSFLLTSQFLRPNLNFKSSYLWINYALKRLLRIYPLYIFVLLVYFSFSSFQYDSIDVLKHLTLVEGLNQFWAIPVEMKYYLILPVVVWLFVKVLRRNLLLSTLACIMLILANEAFKSTFPPKSMISIFLYLPIFLTGSLTALINAEILKWPELSSKRVKYSLEIVAGIAFMIMLCTMRTVWNRTIWSWIFNSEMPDNHLSYILHGCVWSTFLICHLHGQGFFKKILSHVLLRYIGIISFGVYLWHIPVLGYINAHLYAPDSIKFVVIFGITIAVSTITYLTIERPFIRLRTRYSKAKA